MDEVLAQREAKITAQEASLSQQRDHINKLNDTWAEKIKVSGVTGWVLSEQLE